MLKEIKRADVPPVGGKEPSPIRRFAAEVVEELLPNARAGQVFEVSGWPDDGTVAPARQAQRVRQAVREALWHADRELPMAQLELFCRKERLFIAIRAPQTPERVEAMTGKPIRGLQGI